MMEFVYPLLFFIALAYVVFRYFRSNGLPGYFWLVAFIIKMGMGIFFLAYFLEINFKPKEPSDVYRFLTESKQLQAIYFQNPVHYFKLLFHQQDIFDLSQKYLKDTFIWTTDAVSMVNETRNLIRLHSIIHFISGHNPYIHVLIFNFLALIGLKKIMETIQNYSLFNPKYIAIFLLFIPSLLFWSSGILKESLIVLGIGLLVHGLLIQQKKMIVRLFQIVIGALLLFLFKTYILAFILPLIFIHVLTRYLFRNNLKLSLITCASAGILSIAFIPNLSSKITTKISRKQFDMINVGEGGIHLQTLSCYYYFRPQWYKNFKIEGNFAVLTHPSKAYRFDLNHLNEPELVHLKPTGEKWWVQITMPGTNTYFETTRINYATATLIKTIPESLFNAWFRPFFGENGGAMKLLAFVELWAITALFVTALIKRRTLAAKERALVTYLILFALSLLLLIGWTTPISGALVRFRFPAQLAIVLASFIIFKQKISTQNG